MPPAAVPSTTSSLPTALSSPSPATSAAEPSLWSNVEQTAQRLAETRSDPRARLKLVLQIREALDITQTADVDSWLRLMFGPLTRALSETRPAFSEADVDHRIRAALLEILNRLPLGDSLRPYSGQLCSLATRQLAVDNEENGLTCIRILFDCHKHYHPTLEAEVTPFIQFFTSLYTNWETNVKYHFNEQFNQLYNTCMAAIAQQQQGAAGGSGAATAPMQLPAKQLCKASESLKCASESPLVVMMLLQNYQRYVDASVPQLIPLLIKALTQPAHKEPPPLPAALVNALTAANNSDGTPAAPQDEEKAAQDRATLRSLERERDSRFRAALSDFYTAQVKCVSFIAHIFRGYAQHIQTQQDTLAVCVVQLLQSCPGDFPLARKDLLVAIRHMLLSDFKKALLRQAPKLLDEKLLIGEGKLVFDTLRPLAYATLADVVHQIKGELTLPQLSRIVYVFSRNLHDTSLPLSVQSQSVRILLNLVDQIHRSSDATDGRHNGRALLVRILHTLTAKLEALQSFIPKLTTHIQRNSTAMLTKIDANTNIASGVTYPTLLTLPSPTPVSSAAATKGEDELEDVIRELRLMISTMVMGMKTVLWCLKESKTMISAAGKKYPQPMDDDEIGMVCRLLESGLRCFRIYSLQVPPHLSTALPAGDERAEKDVIEQFATIFTQMETRAFREVLTLKMDALFHAIVDNPKSPLIYVPQHFLGSNLQPNTGGAAGNQAAIGRVFADILLTFLTRRLRDMSAPFTESAANATYVHLFRHVFASVEVNDVVLRPYIAPIVTSILRLVSEVKNPINYFAILRALFRSIGGGKFELLYKEFLPVLGDLVGTLMRMQTKGPPATREIALELSLTLPARLSSLLAYIPILIRAVLRAFQSKEDTIVKLGLRTLDFWVDNLNPDYLYPHCRPLLNELFTGLCALLRPQPYSSYGSQALSVLGKFGGKNRRFLIEGVELAWKERKEEGLTMAAEWLQPAGQQGDAQFTMPMGRTIDIAYKMLASSLTTNSYSASSSASSTAFAAESSLQCFHFLRTCLLCLLDTSGDVNAVWSDGGYKKYQPYNAEWQAEQERLTEETRRVKEEAEREKQKGKDEDRDKERKREREKEKAKRRGNKAALKQLQEDEENDRREKEAAAAAALAARNAPPTAAAVPPPTPLPALNEDELLSLRHRILSSASHATCKQLVAATVIAAADGMLMRQGADALDFVRGLCMHFAAVCASGREKPTKGESVDGDRNIGCSVFVEAVVDVMADETQERRDMAYACLNTFLTSLIQLVGVDAAGERATVSDLLSALCHCCHLERWEAKQAGCLGLSLLCASLSSSWIINNQMELIKSLMATYTDDKQQHTETTADKATAALHTIITATCQHARETMGLTGKESAVAASEAGVAENEERKEKAAAESGVSVMEVVVEEKEQKEERKEQDKKEETKEEEKKEAPADEMKEMDIHMQTEDDSASAKLPEQPNAAVAATTTAIAAPAAAVALTAPRVVLDERSSPPLRHLIAIVAPCLISNGSAMRQAAQQLLAFISQQTNRSLFDLLYPHREHLLQHVYSKALHTLSIAVRIGHLSAASYLLTLSPQPLVSVERLSYLVKVVMDVVDEEQHLTGNFNSRTGRAQLWTKLRVESLHLMSAALAHEDVRRDPKAHREWKEQVIKIFFRNLLSRNPDINSAAKAGLHAVLLKEKIPKELLQLCLRPILLNLADHRKLSVALLEGLARLLELLSSCFNVTLGEKLLDHLKHFSTVEGLTRMREEAQQDKTNTLIRLKPDEEVKIPLCVIELFHLLPPAPEGKFLEALIGIVLRLEEVLPLLMCGGLAVLGPTQVGPNCSVIGAAREKEREREAAREKEMKDVGVSSPYRLPLLKFLNKTPKKSLEYLFRSLHRKRVSALLLSLLRLPEAEPLREFLYQHPDFLTLWTFHYDRAVAEATLMPPASAAQPTAQQQLPAAVATADGSSGVPATQPDGNGTAAASNGSPTPLDQPPTFSSTSDTNPSPVTDNSTIPPAQTQPATSNGDANMTPADGQSVTGMSPTPSTATATAQPAAAGASVANGASAITPAAAAELEERTVQGTNIVHVLSSHNPSFIGGRIIKCLLDVWDSKQRIGRLMREETLPIHHVDETRLLVLCLLTYSKQHRDDVHVMWKLLSAFRIRSLIDLTFLADYLDVELNATYSMAEKRRLVRELLKYVDSNSTSASSKSRAFKHVIRPLIKHWLKSRPVRSVQEVKDEQLRLVSDKRGTDGASSTAERRESGRSMDDGADDASKAADMEDKTADAVDDGNSFGSASGDSTQSLPPVWLEDDLLDTEMADSLMRTLSAEHSSQAQDEVSRTARSHTHTDTQALTRHNNIFVNPAE